MFNALVNRLTTRTILVMCLNYRTSPSPKTEQSKLGPPTFQVPPTFSTPVQKRSKKPKKCVTKVGAVGFQSRANVYEIGVGVIIPRMRDIEVVREYVYFGDP